VPARIDDVRDLPPVTKAELMAHFDEWVTDPEVTRVELDQFLADQALVGELYLGRYSVSMTSGTTAEPAIFLHDGDARKIYEAVRLVRGILTWVSRDSLQLLRRKGGREAFIVAMGGHFATFSMAERRRKRYPGRVGVFSVLAPTPQLVEELNQFQPAVVATYPSVLELLSYEQMAGELSIDPVLIASGAETLTAATRQRVTEAFNCPVRDAYGTSECPNIAFDCTHGRMHVNTDWVILEPVDRHYNPVPPGEASDTVLVTNLANRVQPIIRYDQGDSVTVSPDPCPCGNPLPAVKVEGRRAELLTFPSENGEAVRLLPVILDVPVTLTQGVRRYQIVHAAPTTLRIRLEFEPDAVVERVWEEVARRLGDSLADHGLSFLEIQKAQEPPQRDPVSGKYLQVVVEEKARKGVT
jgi:phenylacetate-coenzyme A ligase PaaK-like adenylate-forming protein